MQSKLDYKTHTKNVDFEPLKNIQHFLAKITPRMLILNPSRTHNTLDQQHSLQKPFLKLTNTQLQYSKKEIEYT